MKKRGFKSFVAMLAMVSMLLENTASVAAFTADTSGTYAPESETVQSSETAEVTSEAVAEPKAAEETEASSAEGADSGAASEQTGEAETDTERTAESDTASTVQPDEDQEGASETTESSDTAAGTQAEDGSQQVEPVVELTVGENGDVSSDADAAEKNTAAEEEAVVEIADPVVEVVSEEQKTFERSLSVSDDGRSLSGSGYEELFLSFNASDLGEDTYSLYLVTNAEARYNGEPVNGVITGLSRTTGTLQISNLQNNSFLIYIAGENTNTLAAEYVINSTEDGTVRVRVYDSGKEQSQERLSISETGITGSGYDSLSLSVAFDGTEGETAFSYYAYVVSQAEGVAVNGYSLTDGRVSFDSQTSRLEVTGLEGKQFTISLQGGRNYKADVSYSFNSEADEAAAVLTYAYAADTRQVYTYEDDLISVTATVEKPEAIPDDAVFFVKKIETGTAEYIELIDALNKNAEEGKTYDDNNTLAYDISFFTDETRTVEIEPEEGSVNISFKFKKDQLSNEIDAGESLEINHAHETNGELEIKKLEESTTVSEEEVSFDMDSFSRVMFTGSSYNGHMIRIRFLNENGATIDPDPMFYNYLIYINDPNPEPNTERKHILLPLDKGEYNRETGLFMIPDSVYNQRKFKDYNENKVYDVSIWMRSAANLNLSESEMDNDPEQFANQLIKVDSANGYLFGGIYKLKMPAEGTTLAQTYDIEATKIDVSGNGTTSVQDILGEAANYGIVANTYEQIGDSQTNFAVNNFKDNAAIMSDLSNYPGNYYVGNLLEDTKLQLKDTVNDPYYVYYNSEAIVEGDIQESNNKGNTIRVPLSSKEISDKISSLMNGVNIPKDGIGGTDEENEQDKRSWLVLPNSTGDYKKYLVDTAGLPEDAVVHIDLDSSTTLKKLLGETGEVLINKLPSQVIIFHGRSDITINKILYSSDGDYDFDTHTQTYKTNAEKNSGGFGNQDLARFAKTIIWDLQGVSNVTLKDSPTGVIYAPYATVNFESGAGSGWIVANEVVSNVEWHNIYQQLTSATEIQINAQKTIDGNTPESSQKFNFELYKYTEGTGWGSPVQTKKNQGGSVAFDPVKLSSEGDVWFLVKEKAQDAPAGYDIDARQYIVKAVVDKNESAAKTVYTLRGMTIYETGDIDKAKAGTASVKNAIAFDNKESGDHGDLVISKKLVSDTWTLRCELPHAEPRTPYAPSTHSDEGEVNWYDVDKNTGGGGHRKKYCGQFSHYIIYTNEDTGKPEHMIEVKTDNLGDLECYVTKVYKTSQDEPEPSLYEIMKRENYVDAPDKNAAGTNGYVRDIESSKKLLETVEIGDTICWYTKSGNNKWLHFGKVGQFAFTIVDEAGLYYDEKGVSHEEKTVVYILADEELKIENLPVGKYKITEEGTQGLGNQSGASFYVTVKSTGSDISTSNNNGATSFSATVELGENGANIEFNNDQFPKVVPVEITKTVDGAEPGKGETFTFEAFKSDSNGNQGSAVSKKETDSDGHVKFYLNCLANEGTAEGDLARTYYFLLKEVDTNGNYVYDKSQYLVKARIFRETVNSPWSGKEVHVYQLYDRNGKKLNSMQEVPEVKYDNYSAGYLTIKKTLTGSKKNENDKFYVVVYSNNNNVITYYKKDGGSSSGKQILEISETSSEGITIPKLPLGTYYVKEVTKEGGDVDNTYTVTVSGDGVTAGTDGISGSVVLDLNNKQRTVIINNAETGSITIGKTVSSPSEVSDAAFYATVSSGSLYYDLNGNTAEAITDDNKSSFVHKIYPVNNNIVINNLPLGRDYVITETDANGKTVTQDSPYHVTIDGEDATSKTVSLSLEKKNAAVEIVNAVGTLVVRKFVSNDGKASADTEFYVTIQNPSGKYYYMDETGEGWSNDIKAVKLLVSTTKDGSGEDKALILSNLPFGDYTVKEVVAVKDSSGNITEVKEPGAGYRYGISVSGANDNVVNINNGTDKAEVDITNTLIYGSVSLEKMVEGSAEKAGIGFTLTKDGDTTALTVSEKTNGVAGAYVYDPASKDTKLYTDSDGRIVVEGLEIGSYHFNEFSTLNGYALDTGNKAVEVTAENAPLKDSKDKNDLVIFTNTTFDGKVTFKKVIDNNAGELWEGKDTGLDGASFTLKTAAGSDVDTNVTADENGIVEKSGLAKGEYYFIENEKTGYATLPADTKLWFTIGEENTGNTPATLDVAKINSASVVLGTDGIARVNNTRNKGTVELEKLGRSVFSTSDTPLSGVTFELWADVDTAGQPLSGGNFAKYGEGTTDADGKLSFSDLPWGTYQLKETNVGDSNKGLYKEDGLFTSSTFVIGVASGEKLNYSFTGENAIVNTRKSGDFMLVKYDKETKEVIDGAAFDLYRGSTETAVSVIDSVKSGITGHDEGTAGYNEAFVTAVAAALEKTEGIVKVNKESLTTTGGVLDKNGYNGKLKDAYLIDGGLEVGEYFLVETTAPVGMKLSYSPVGFNLDGVSANPDRKVVVNNEGLKVVQNGTADGVQVDAALFVENEEKTGEVTLRKLDETDGNRALSAAELSGAEFELWYAQRESTKPFIDKAADWFKGLFRDPAEQGYNKAITLTFDAAGNLSTSGAAEGVKAIVFEETGDDGNKNAAVRITGLKWGDYYFKEITAPKGYVKEDGICAQFSIGVTYNEGVWAEKEGLTPKRSISNTEQTGSVEFTKVDGTDTTKKLSGAQFWLYKYNESTKEYERFTKEEIISDSEKRILGIFRSNANTGKVSVTGLPWGQYRFVEVAAPEGYETEGTLTTNEDGSQTFTETKDTKHLDFTINATNASATAVYNLDEDASVDNAPFTNRPVKRDLELIKYSGSIKNPVPFEKAVFTVKVKDGSQIKVTKTANGEYAYDADNGETMDMVAEGGEKGNKLIVRDLPVGVYEVTEVDIPADKKTAFSVKSEPVEFSVTNNVDPKNPLYTETKDANGNVRYVYSQAFYNANIDARVRFIKVDSDNNNTGIGGIRFRVYQYVPGENGLPLESSINERTDMTAESNSGAEENIDSVTEVQFTEAESSEERRTQGEVEITGLSEGYYYLQEDEETAEKLGYEYNDTKYFFHVGWENAWDAKTKNYVPLSVYDEKSGVLTQLQKNSNGDYLISNTEGKGSVSLTKVEANNTGKTIPGVTFGLFRSGNNSDDAYYTADSGSNGVVSFTNIPWGTYTLKEISAPAAYELSEREETITFPRSVSQGSTQDPLSYSLGNWENTPVSGSVVLIKVDARNNDIKLNDAKFTLYKYDPEKTEAEGLDRYVKQNGYENLSTQGEGDNAGKLSIPGLSYGFYYLLETEAPQGYVTPMEEITVDSQAVKLPSKRIFFRIDRDHEAPQDVAKTFTESISDALSSTYENGKNNGNVITNDERDGEYLLKKEVQVSTGETPVDLSKVHFTFKLEGKSSDSNTKDIVKTDVTDDTGLVSFKDLPWGKYTLTEETMPGYEPLYNGGNPFVVEIGRADTVEKTSPDITFINKKNQASIHLVKLDQDDDKTKLNDAVFTLLDGNRVTTGRTFVAGDKNKNWHNGEITIDNLEWGKVYYLQETVLPEGYTYPSDHPDGIWSLGTADGTLPASAVNTPLEITAKNRKLGNGTVKIHKISSQKDDDGKDIPIAGVTFSLHKMTKNGASYVSGAEIKVKASEADENGKTVTVYSPAENGEAVLTTDKDGYIRIEGLQEGKYCVKELGVPDDLKAQYTVDTSVEHVIEVRENEETNKEIVNSSILAGVKFTKFKSVNGVVSPLPGVEFDLYITDVEGNYDSNKAPYDTITSDENGVVSKGSLPEGYYCFVERSTPNNAFALGGPYYFHIASDEDRAVVGLDKGLISDNTVSFERLAPSEDGYRKVYNTPSRDGEISIVKMDDKGKLITEPIEFELHRAKLDSNGQVIFKTRTEGDSTVPTDVPEDDPGWTIQTVNITNGTETITGLSWGAYFFIEKPYGDNAYDIEAVNSKPEIAWIGEASMKEPITITNTKRPASVSLEKKDKNTEEPLAYVQFTLYEGDPKYKKSVGTITTDADGKGSLEIPDPVWGTSYTLVETDTDTSIQAGSEAEEEAKKPYQLKTEFEGDATGVFTVDKDNLDFSFTAVNEKKQGYVTFTKKDSRKELPMAGVEFSLFTEDGTELTDHIYRTDAQGVIRQYVKQSTEQAQGTEATGAPSQASAGASGENGAKVGPLDYGRYYFIEKDTPEGYEPLVEELADGTTVSRKIWFSVIENEKEVKTEKIGDSDAGIVLNTPRTGKIRIKKVDSDDPSKELAGAVIRLSKTDEATSLIEQLWLAFHGSVEYLTKTSGNYTETAGTEHEGYIVFEDIPQGTYKLEEITTPAGYKVDTSDIKWQEPFTITSDNVYTFEEIEIPNKQLKGSVILEKQDADGELITNAENDETKSAAFKLYYYKEATKLWEDMTAELGNKNGFKDYFRSSFTDPNNSANVLRNVFVTDQDGKISFTGILDWGTYRFEEVAAPKGYAVSDEYHSFTISAEDYVAPKDAANENGVGTMAPELVEVVNNKGYGFGALQKVFGDGETDQPSSLAGIRFKLFDAAGNAVNIDSTSIAEAKKNGVPVYKAQSSENGYVVSVQGVNISVESEGLYLVKNGQVEKLAEQDADGYFTTDGEGKIGKVGPLPYGAYHFEEGEIPEGSAARIAGYNQSLNWETDGGGFEVTANGSVTEVIYNNAKVFGKVGLRKIAGTGGTLIDKITFDRYALPEGGFFRAVQSADGEWQINTGDGFVNVPGEGFYKVTGEGAVKLTPVPGETKKEADTDGFNLTFDNIPMGTYFLVENAASAKALGYRPDESIYYFKIETQGESAVLYKDAALTQKVEGNEIPNTAYETGKIGFVKKLDGQFIQTEDELSKFLQGTFVLRKADERDENGDEKIFKIIDANDVIGRSYTDDKGNTVSYYRVEVEVPLGSYYFEETAPVPGYALPEGNHAKTGVINLQPGNIASYQEEPLTNGEIDNSSISISFAKKARNVKDLVTGVEENGPIAGKGGTVELYNAADAENIDTAEPIQTIYLNSGKTVALTGLEAGGSYILHEKEAPLGFARAKDVYFSVNATGTGLVLSEQNEDAAIEGTTIVLYDEPTVLTVDKRVLTDNGDMGDRISGGSGGKLQIFDKQSNKVVEEWSIGENMTLTGKLVVSDPSNPHLYVLHEEEAPDGYFTAPDVEFYLTRDNDGADGTIVINKVSWSGTTEDEAQEETPDGSGRYLHVRVDGKTLNLLDRPVKLEVRKLRFGSENVSVVGAELALFEKTGAQVEPLSESSWTTTGEATVIDLSKLKIRAGETYYIKERSAADQYRLSEGVLGEVKIPASEAGMTFGSNGIDLAGEEKNSILSKTVYNDLVYVKVAKQGEQDVFDADNFRVNLKGAWLAVTDERGEDVLNTGSKTTVAIETNGGEQLKELNYFATGGLDTLLVGSGNSLSDDEIEELKKQYGVAQIVYADIEKGGNYKIYELKAPDGYARKKTATSFSIDAETGWVEFNEEDNKTVVISDKPLAMSFDKKSYSDQSLSGAKLVLLNDKKVPISEEWTTVSGKPFIATNAETIPEEYQGYGRVKLLDGVVLKTGTYYLSETEAPTGYYKNKWEQEFILTDDNDISSPLSVVMKDLEVDETAYTIKKEWIVPDKEADFVYPTISLQLTRKFQVSGGQIAEEENVGEPWIVDDQAARALLSEHGEISKSYGDLPRYGVLNGEKVPYTYSVKETIDETTMVSPYTKYAEPVIELKGDVMKVTNRLESEWPRQTYKAYKNWVLPKNENGTVNLGLAEEVTFTLYRRASKPNELDDPVQSITVKPADLDPATGGLKAPVVFDEVPKYDQSTGELYRYVIRETPDPDHNDKFTGTDYISDGGSYEKGAYVFTNTPIEQTFDISGRKIWYVPEGVVLPKVEIRLYRDGVIAGRALVGDDNTFRFEGVKKYHSEKGFLVPYTYTMKEYIAGTETEVKEGGKYTVTTPTIHIDNETPDVVEAVVENVWNNEKITIRGTKYWPYERDYTERPMVTIELYKRIAGSEEYADWTYVESRKIPYYNNQYSFTVDKYDYSGRQAGVPGVPKLIEYKVVEVGLDGYVSSPAAGYEIRYGEDGIAYAADGSEFESGDFTNTPSRIDLSKVDITDNSELHGAELAVVDASGKQVDSWTSTGVPHRIQGLSIGAAYTLKELKAPEGYKVAEDVQFTVGDDGAVQTVVMKDTPIIGSLTLTKADAETKELLAGAEFRLYTKAGSPVYVKMVELSTSTYRYAETGETDAGVILSSAGVLTVTDLPYGEYYIEEVKAPQGYELNASRRYTFSVSAAEADASVTIDNTRKKGSVRLRKLSTADRSLLPGATFELYSSTPATPGQAVASTVYSDAYYRYGTYKTDSNGEINVTGLPWDDYYFIEIEAPENYRLLLDSDRDPLVYTFKVNERTVDDIIYAGDVYNTPGDMGGGEPTPEPTVYITSTPTTYVTTVPTTYVTTTPTTYVTTTPTTYVTSVPATPTPGVEGTIVPPTTPPAGVLGERRIQSGSPIQSVLGVRSAPTQGVLGERVGPATGDAANIALWLIILGASIGAIVVIVVQSSKKKKNR